MVAKEKYYVAVQTLYLPDWETRLNYLRDWYKHRKVVVANPRTGRAIIAVVADSGPAYWTGKHFGGSPEVMNYLESKDGRQKGPVILFFVDDPEDKVPLGPLEYNLEQNPLLLAAQKSYVKVFYSQLYFEHDGAKKCNILPAQRDRYTKDCESMSKIFYDHLVIREEIDFELNRFQIDPEEQEELINLIDQTLHHHILNIILNHLPKEKHPEFITRLHADPNDGTLIDYLKTHAHPEIEAEIRKQAVKIKKEILADLKKSSRRTKVLAFFRSRELVITETEDNAMANPASSGSVSVPTVPALWRQSEFPERYRSGQKTNFP